MYNTRIVTEVIVTVLAGSNVLRSIDTEGVDLPVSIDERLRVLVDDW